MSEMEINRVLTQMRALSGDINKPAPTENPEGPGFARVLDESISNVNKVQQEARTMAADWEKGKTDVELADVMVAMQKSSLSFQAMMEVRNKLGE